MDSPVSAISYLSRAQSLSKSEDKASLIYSALELRCGVEARLQEHASLAIGVAKSQATQWEIKKLAKTIESAFGLGDSFLIVTLQMGDGRACEFLYAPVSSRLQEIAKRFGVYLHAVPPHRVQDPMFWSELKSMLEEGCRLLELACSSELLRPSIEHGLHFALAADDPRIEILEDLQSGATGAFSSVKFTPSAPMTFYPADEV